MPDESDDALRRLGERIENYRSDCSVIVKAMIVGTTFILSTFLIFYLIWLATR